MERFENAKVGDDVYSDAFGDGRVMNIKENSICVTHGRLYVTYDKKGNYYDTSIYKNKPVLYYRKGEDSYLTERHEPKIDWENEKPGTRFEVSQDGISYSQKTFAGILSIGDDHFPVFLTATLCDTYQYWNHIRRIK